MHFYYGYAWDKGDYYTLNQDSFSLQAVLTGGGPAALAVVCDGVGGLSRGEYAGGYVAGQITAWFYDKALPKLCTGKGWRNIRRSLKRELEELHDRLTEQAEKEEIHMGTTMTILMVFRHHYYLFHVGDSRCYSLGKKINLLTKDQVGEKRELLYAVGVGEQPVVFAKHGRCKSGQRFLLCTDGFYRNLSSQTIEALKNVNVRSCHDFEKCIRKILEESIHRGRMKGERDNCTAILLECC